MGKKYIFQNVNINSIKFVNNKNDIKFDFLDSYANSGKYCGELICTDILSLTMKTDLGDEPYFPQFICDVSIEEFPGNSEHHLVVFEGGTYYISLICNEIMYQ
ncbi:MAG: hypothetical protein FWH57_11865 [Oscillospiraceae bacterium]|nr:hypothetical protein [Oscillospiraceae bacterium]